jgi:hypothetical protein
MIESKIYLGRSPILAGVQDLSWQWWSPRFILAVVESKIYLGSSGIQELS